MSAVLSMAGVSRVYGEGELAVLALAGIDLAVAEGELVAVMGPSGSGKTTLLQIAGALDEPSAGSVVVDGHEVVGLGLRERTAVRRRCVGVVFQELNLVDTLTLLENVALPLELDGRGRRESRELALAAMRLAGVAELARRFPGEVSGGQRQQVAIARGVVGGRRLLLADEPTGALDSTTGETVVRLLRERVDAGAAGLLATHDPRVAGWADRVVFLRDGRVTDSATAASAEQLLEAR